MVFIMEIREAQCICQEVKGGGLIEEEVDSPEKNVLFQMLSELTKELQKREIGQRFDWFYDFSDWQKFCQFAVNVYDKKRRE